MRLFRLKSERFAIPKDKTTPTMIRVIINSYSVKPACALR